jgi:TRAP-type C4-dicarboxylate transport system permease small subunit
MYAGFAFLAGMITLCLVVVTVVDFVGRTWFYAIVKGGIELSQQMMAFLVAFGLAYTLVKGGHVRVTLAFSRFPPKTQIVAEVFTDLIGIFLFSLLVWGGLEHFWQSWVAKEWMPAAIRIPYWPAKLALPLGFFLMGFEFIVSLIRHLAELRRLLRKDTSEV